jgi:hypothetical protein
MNLFWRHKEKTGKELEVQANQLGVSLQGAWKEVEVGDLDDVPTRVLDEAELQRRVREAHTAHQNTVINRLQTIGIVGGLALTLILAVWSQHRQSIRESADLMIKFNDSLSSGGSGSILRALDRGDGLDQMKLGGGALADAMDDFFTKYEVLAAAFRYDLINKDMAFDLFSGDLEAALNDATIRKYVAESLGEEADEWDGVLQLARVWNLKFPPITPISHSSAPGAHLALPRRQGRARGQADHALSVFGLLPCRRSLRISTC